MPVKAGATIDPDATRARVLEAAARLFYERSLAAVGMREVATESNASQLTIYRYFGSKEGLAEAVVRARSDRTHAWLREQLAELPPGRERVLAVFDLLTRWYAERNYRGCPVINYTADSRGGPTASDVTRGHLQRYRDLMRELLTEAGVRQPDPLIGQMLLLVEGSSVVTQIDGSADCGADARAAAATLLDAALVSGNTVPQPE